MIAFLLLLIPVQNALAEVKPDAPNTMVREEDRVRKIELQDEGQAYEVAFWGLAAIYTVPKAKKDVVRCLMDSARKSKTVRLEIRAATGEILRCK